MLFKRIKDLREDSDRTQTQMGQILNISQRTYSNYETGSRSIPAEIMIKLAAYYNTSVDYLMGLTDIKEPYPAAKTCLYEQVSSFTTRASFEEKVAENNSYSPSSKATSNHPSKNPEKNKKK